MDISEGDFVSWMLPLDHEYSYGRVDKLYKSFALVTHVGGFYDGKQIEVHLRYIQRGGSKVGGKVKRRRK